MPARTRIVVLFRQSDYGRAQYGSCAALTRGRYVIVQKVVPERQPARIVALRAGEIGIGVTLGLVLFVVVPETYYKKVAARQSVE